MIITGKMELSKDINYRGRISRVISVDRKLDLEEGQECEFYKDVESWAGEHAEIDFDSRQHGDIMYFFTCKDGEGHMVDYENEEECILLGAENCQDEGEILVNNTNKFEIVSLSTDDDYEEMKYYEVVLKRI